MGPLALTVREAALFLPLVGPLCFYVAWSDCRALRIPNGSVLLLAAIFLCLGPFALPLAEWAWRWVHLLVVLLAGMALTAAGTLGAGDAKFAAAAAPFIALADLTFVMVLMAAMVLGAFGAHRLVKHTPLRRLAPRWLSWRSGRDFPMGLALGGTLGLYLALGLILGTSV